MNITTIASKLFEGIKHSFDNQGFKFIKKGKMFVRKIDNAEQIVDFYFFKNQNSIKIKPEVRIKIREIDEVYRSIALIENRPFLILGNHLFEIVRYCETGEEIGKKNLYDWLIEDEDDINKLIQIIPEYLEEFIIPYFEENNTISRVDYLLNKYPRDLSIHNYLYPLRVNIAIIAARLNKNPAYKTLISIYDEEMANAEENYKKEFEKLKALELG